MEAQPSQNLKCEKIIELPQENDFRQDTDDFVFDPVTGYLVSQHKQESLIYPLCDLEDLSPSSGYSISEILNLPDSDETDVVGHTIRPISPIENNTVCPQISKYMEDPKLLAYQKLGPQEGNRNLNPAPWSITTTYGMIHSPDRVYHMINEDFRATSPAETEFMLHIVDDTSETISEVGIIVISESLSCSVPPTEFTCSKTVSRRFYRKGRFTTCYD